MTDIKIRISDGRKETPFWKRILNGLVFVSVLFVPGLLADSAAMQWAGFVFLLAMIVLLPFSADFKPMTIEEARKRLDELDQRERKATDQRAKAANEAERTSA